MKHPIEAKFRPGETVVDIDTAERGEVVAVDYDEVLEKHIYLVQLADGREESYLDVVLKKPGFSRIIYGRVSAENLQLLSHSG
jgi:hypothetical protein